MRIVPPRAGVLVLLALGIVALALTVIWLADGSERIPIQPHGDRDAIDTGGGAKLRALSLVCADHFTQEGHPLSEGQSAP